MINGDDFEFVLTFGKRFLSHSVTTDGARCQMWELNYKNEISRYSGYRLSKARAALLSSSRCIHYLHTNNDDVSPFFLFLIHKDLFLSLQKIYYENYYHNSLGGRSRGQCYYIYPKYYTMRYWMKYGF